MHPHPTRPVALLAFLLLTIAASFARAQEVTPPPARRTPAVVGVVRDSAGIALPNVQVVITSLNRVTSTDGTGTFTFRGLPPGHYHLDAVMLGFARADADFDVPAEGDDVRLAITMRPSALRLSGVVVAASPTGADALNITQSTIELSGKELARNLGASVAQTLSGEPGMASRYNGPMASTPIIRGLSGERILVLQDGDRTGDLSATSADHALSADPLAASRIEVVRGPASLLYGTNALGGVVNVVSNEIPTSVPSHIEGFLAGQGERVNPGGALSGAVTVPLGGHFALSARGGLRNGGDTYLGGGGRLQNTALRSNSQGVALGYIGDRATGGVAYSRFDFRYGLPAAAGDEELGAKIDGIRDQVRGRLEWGAGRTGLVRLIRIDGSAQWYGHDEIESSGEIATAFDLRTQTVNAVARTTVGAVQGAIGFNGIFRQYAATGEEALTPAANTSGGGLFVFQEFPLRRDPSGDSHAMIPKLQVGGRLDLLTIDSKPGEAKFGAPRSLDFNNASGSIGITLPLRRRTSLGVSVARAFRAPTVEELFSNAIHHAVGTYDVGNPALEAEVNEGIDAVLRAQGQAVDVQLSGYVNRISNYIAPNIVGDTMTDEGLIPLNRFAQGDATLRGVEGRIEGTVARRFILGAMGDLVRGRFADDTPLPFMPAARVGAHARWEAGRISAGGEVRHAFAQQRTSGGDVDIPTAAYTLFNLSTSYTYIGSGLVHSITLRADNLLDERYLDATSRIKSFAPNPGRNVAVVYRVLF